MSISGRSTVGSPVRSTSGFLSFNSRAPRLYITSEDDEFDDTTIEHWKDEGSSYYDSGRVTR